MKKVMNITVSITMVIVVMFGILAASVYAHGFRYDSEHGWNKYYFTDDGRYYCHSMHLNVERALEIWDYTDKF